MLKNRQSPNFLRQIRNGVGEQYEVARGGGAVGVNLDCSVVVTFRLMYLGATSTSKTSGIGGVSVA